MKFINESYDVWFNLISDSLFQRPHSVLQKIAENHMTFAKIADQYNLTQKGWNKFTEQFLILRAFTVTQRQRNITFKSIFFSKMHWAVYFTFFTITYSEEI